MRDANFAANSQVMRELLYEITVDANLTARQHRDHTYVINELKRRLNDRYGIQVTTFNLIPRDSSHITVEALGEGLVHARIIHTHFADTLFIAKRKHYSLWQPNLQPA